MINTSDVIEELLTEIAPDLNALGVLQHEDSKWAIVYGERSILELDYTDDRHCLTLLTGLGTPPRPTQVNTYRYLMAYSSLSELTGGIRIALDAPDGELVQLLDLFTEDLDRVTLESAINQFHEAAEAWRKVVETGIEESSPYANVTNGDSVAPGGDSLATRDELQRDADGTLSFNRRL